MCGIAGEVRFDGRAASAAVVERMTGAQERRGPDGVGIVARQRIAFGHRRLKIIDLSEQSHQPMVDVELGLTGVFNGCIYNYRELRAELQAQGYRFFSDGDTEVFLKAFHAWGPGCVERFNGMFAFAVHDRRSDRVVLGRDRLGIKPLYLTEVDGAVRFASTLPALLAGGGVDTALDEAGLHHYLSFHAVVPAPLTLLKGVRKLPPATLLTLHPDGRREELCYWTPAYGPQPGDEKRSFDEWMDLVLSTLRTAVSRRLVADVPVGVLLSGGLDSSLIVGLIAEQRPEALRTFSIGFETVNGEEGDEFKYSDFIARRFDTTHEKLFIDSAAALPAVQASIAAMSEPMVSHDNVGFFLLSQVVSQHVKVVQSGQGADEVFAGYHWYPPMVGAEDPVSRYAEVFFDRDHAELSRLLHPSRLGADHSRAFVEAHFARPGAEASVDKALRLDTTVMLVEDPVKRVDNMTMAFGLEARVPFLDHEVVELAARIPAELKLRDGGKYVLKEAARRVIPKVVIDRPKGYFPVPALKYLQGPFLELVRDTLGSRRARERELFQADAVATFLREPEAHLTPLRGSKLWQVAVLELWLQHHGL